MNFRRIKAIAKKEFKHLLRDYRMLTILLFFPVFLLGIFGYAVNFDVKHVKLAILDNEKSDVSLKFIHLLQSSEYFDVVQVFDSYSNTKHLLDSKSAQCVVIIPNDLSKNIFANREAKLQILIDGVDGNTAGLIQSYMISATKYFSLQLTNETLSQKGLRSIQPVDYKPLFWYNPDLKSTRFLLPGLIAMILIITCVVSVSLSLVREKERGTIEQINVSPLQTTELLLGKTFPYILVALINATMILIVGNILFDVSVHGSLLMLFGVTLLFLFASTSLGIFVSVISDSLQVAFTISTFVSLLPSVILSGFIFPIESMPIPIQVISNITPAKFYIVALRAIILRGVGVTAFWEQLVYLVLFSVLFLGGATKIYANQQKNL
ncbi:MAG: ABC transporter permease [Ignavibacteriaceae bacterium]|jgi:ABC-2 type transport system permease protein